LPTSTFSHPDNTRRKEQITKFFTM
jgi:hypothetical protein